MNGILKTETIMEDKKGNIYKGRKMAQGQLVCFMDVNSVVFQKVLHISSHYCILTSALFF